MIRRRSAIEPAIGHMKADGKLDRNWLKGELGDAIQAVLRGAGHNLRMILRKLRLIYVLVPIALLNRPITVVFQSRGQRSIKANIQTRRLMQVQLHERKKLTKDVEPADCSLNAYASIPDQLHPA